MSSVDAIDQDCGADMSEDECPESRDNAGLVFRYDRDTMARQTALEAHCGTLAPRSAVCPDGRRFAGRTYEFDPDEIRRHEAQDEYCGPQLPQSPYRPGETFGDVKGRYAVTAVLDNGWDVVDIGYYTEQCFEGRPGDPNYAELMDMFDGLYFIDLEGERINVFPMGYCRLWAPCVMSFIEPWERNDAGRISIAADLCTGEFGTAARFLSHEN